MNGNCKNCGAPLNGTEKFCENCGSPVESALNEDAMGSTLNGEPREAIRQDIFRPEGGIDPRFSGAPADGLQSGGGNVLLGIIGALLFALIGGAVQFLLYRVNTVASISGIITCYLAMFGYGLFSRRKNTTGGLVTAVIMTVLVIGATCYLCLVFDVYNEYKTIGMSFGESFGVTNGLLKDGEVRSAFLKNLASSYLFGAIGIAVAVAGKVRGNKPYVKKKG